MKINFTLKLISQDYCYNSKTSKYYFIVMLKR